MDLMQHAVERVAQLEAFIASQHQTISRLAAELARSRETVEELKEAEGRLIRQREELQQLLDMHPKPESATGFIGGVPRRALEDEVKRLEQLVRQYSQPEWLLPAVIEYLTQGMTIATKSVCRAVQMSDGTRWMLKVCHGIDAKGWTDPISDAERQQHQRTVQDLSARLDFSRKRVAFLEAQVERGEEQCAKLEQQLVDRHAAHAATAQILDQVRLSCQVPRDPDGALQARVGELERERDLARSAHRSVCDTLARLRHSIRGFARQHAP